MPAARTDHLQAGHEALERGEAVHLLGAGQHQGVRAGQQPDHLGLLEEAEEADPVRCRGSRVRAISTGISTPSPAMSSVALELTVANARISDATFLRLISWPT